MDYIRCKRYVVRRRGRDEALDSFNTVGEAIAKVHEWEEEDKLYRELNFYEIYDTLKETVVK